MHSYPYTSQVKLKEQGNVASGASGAYILSGGDIDAAETNHSSLSEAGSSAKRPHADTSERCSGFAAEFTPRLQLPEHPKRTNTLASLSHAYGKDASPENSRGILQQQGPPRKDLEKIIDKIQKKDAYDVFREPVTEEMVNITPCAFALLLC